MLEQTIDDYLRKVLKTKVGDKEVAFFGGSFTGIDEDIQKELTWKLAYEFVKNKDKFKSY